MQSLRILVWKIRENYANFWDYKHDSKSIFFIVANRKKNIYNITFFFLVFYHLQWPKIHPVRLEVWEKQPFLFFMHSRNIRRCEYVWRFCSLLLLLLDIEWAFRRDMLIKELNTCKCLCIKIGMELRMREEYFSIIENKNTFTYRILWIETHFMHSFVVFCFLFQFFVLLLLWFEY